MKIQFLDTLDLPPIAELTTFKSLRNVNNILSNSLINHVMVSDITTEDVNEMEDNTIELHGVFMPKLEFQIRANTPEFKINISHSNVRSFRIVEKNKNSWLDDDSLNNDRINISINDSNIGKLELTNKTISLQLSRTYIDYLEIYKCDIRKLSMWLSSSRSSNIYNNNVNTMSISDCDLSNSTFSENQFTCINVSNTKLKNSTHTRNVIAGTYQNYFHECQYFYNICPKEGSFVAWKKCKSEKGDCLVKLLIPEDAKRSSNTSNKCRCDKALVLEIKVIPQSLTSQLRNVYPNLLDCDCNETIDEAYSSYDKYFKYKVNEYVEVLPFDDDINKTCTAGIHFFMEKEQAISYTF